jgi:hypothetical protein
MIALSKEPLEDDDRRTPLLLVGPHIVVSHAQNHTANREVNAYDDGVIAAQVARQQAELSMLQLALFRCGLIGQQE